MRDCRVKKKIKEVALVPKVDMNRVKLCVIFIKVEVK